jgi:hypothetical protein
VVVLRAADTSMQQIAQAADACLKHSGGTVTVCREDVRAYLPYESEVRWYHQIADWHRRLSAALGTVSLGHAVRRGAETNDAASAVVQAAEAA